MEDNIEHEDWIKWGKIISYARKKGYYLRVLDEVLWFHRKAVTDPETGKYLVSYANVPYENYNEHGYVGAIERAFEGIKGEEESNG
jgi:hypothetical protein